MKKFLAIIMAAAILVAFAFPAARAEDEICRPHVIHTTYDGVTMYGLAEVPEDGCQYYARLTFFVEGGRYFNLCVPISADGEFVVYVSANCLHLAVQIVDNPYAFPPGTYTVYDYIDGSLAGDLLW